MTFPQDITVSLEWAKKLKEAGWPQDSVFKWISLSDNQHVLWTEEDWRRAKENDEEFDGFSAWTIVAAAPTAEEVLRRLPRTIHDEGGEYVRICFPSGHRNEGIQYKHLGGLALCAAVEDADTLANAAAAMYCYLAENKLLPNPAA